MIIYRTHLTRVGDPVEIQQGRAVALTLQFAKLGPITVAAIYGFAGRKAHAGSKNDRLYTAVTDHLEKSARPYIIAGDLNNLPNAMQKWLDIAAVPATIAATDEVTFIAAKATSVLDYFIYSHDLSLIMGAPQGTAPHPSQGAQAGGNQAT